MDDTAYEQILRQIGRIVQARGASPMALETTDELFQDLRREIDILKPEGVVDRRDYVMVGDTEVFPKPQPRKNGFI